MSKENLIKLMEAAAADEQLGQQLQSAGSFEALKSLAAEHGFDLGDLSPKEAQHTIDVLTGAVTEELSDDELEMVAGGWANEKTIPDLGLQSLGGQISSYLDLDWKGKK